MQLYILPFDHRNSFIKGILGVKDRKATEEEVNKAREFKLIIYEGFKKALEEGVPKEHAGILTDDWLGIDVLNKVKEEGIIFCIPVEESGQQEFQFDKENYKEYIKGWNPDYVKCLVRYNPEGDRELNKRQNERLKELNDFLKQEQYRFMFELLVPATEEQESNEDYDNNIRPNLTVKTIEELHEAGIFPDLWKIEGFDKTEDMQKVADKIKQDPNAKIIILGRGESKEHAEKWLKAGAKVDIAIGFVIGRTTFLGPLEEYNKGNINKKEVIDGIKGNFKHFVKVWEEAKSS